MAWTSTTETSTFDAKEATKTLVGLRNREGKSTVYFGSEYDVVGINVPSIPLMKDEIEKYCKNIEEHLDKINPLASADDAFKSSFIQTAVKGYLEKIKKYCINLTSQLRAFIKKLDDVYETWKKSTKTFAQNIDEKKAQISVGTRNNTTSGL